MFPKSIVYLLFVFNLCGFCTELPESRMTTKWTLTVLASHTICLLLSYGLFHWFWLNGYFYKGIDVVTTVNDVIWFAGAFANYAFVIIESYRTRSMQQRFWRIYRRIHTTECSTSNNRHLISYAIKFGQLFVIFSVVQSKKILHDQFFYAILCGAILLMHQMRIFYYFFFVRLLSHQLDEIDSKCSQVVDACNQLRPIRIYFESVYELSNCINGIFSWSNVVSILFLFLRLTVTLNWSYWKMSNSRNNDWISTYL